MSVSIRKGLSIKRMKRTWHALKMMLEYLHLTEFLLHVTHSDAIALLIVLVTRPLGWITAAFLGACLLHKSPQEVLRMPEAEQPESDQPAPAERTPTELLILAPSVPHDLAQLARDGVSVKITIELKPGAR